ncbi:hypothetical protein [Streptomyces sp. NBC_01443]|uniref:hypothetical protein n=1 Tax=Streptomyces sp. NBC_01443 TaxID=2903868 RepID=UPI002258FB17|nr:hypothetical protein [Streptomyces sp. NBC_01443]MCX4632875.1 hypothetical protein [Streptomyces sp. NBC_01443]
MNRRKDKEPGKEPSAEQMLLDLLGNDDRGGYQPVDKQQEPAEPPESGPGVSSEAPETSQQSGEV